MYKNHYWSAKRDNMPRLTLQVRYMSNFQSAAPARSFDITTTYNDNDNNDNTNKHDDDNEDKYSDDDNDDVLQAMQNCRRWYVIDENARDEEKKHSGVIDDNIGSHHLWRQQ